MPNTMYALVMRDGTGKVSLSMTQDNEGDAKWFRDRKSQSFSTMEFIVCPFASYVDIKHSSGDNPHPMRPDFNFDHWKGRQT